MRKTVRLQNNIVVEIIPEYALPVAQWYGPAFAAQCVEASDEVEQGWVYEPESGEFSPPGPQPPPEPTPEDRIKALESRNEFLEDCMAEMAMAVYGV